MSKRILSFLLALMLVVTCFALTSCKKEDVNSGNKDNEQNNNEKDDLQINLSDEKHEVPSDLEYNGYTFKVFAPYPSGISRFVSEELNNTPINDAIYNRNLAVQDELGVTIKALDFTTYTDKQAEKIIDSVFSGDHSFDVAAIHSTSACAALIIADAVLSFDNLEYVDLEKPWWIKEFSEVSGMLDKEYFGISSACYSYYDYAGCILFNKDLAEENNLPDLYQLVRDGEWTVDKLIELTQGVSFDRDGDGVIGTEDVIAISCDNFGYMNFWYGAFRQPTVTKGENDEPVYQVSTPRMRSVVEKLHTLFNSGNRGIIYEMNGERDLYNEIFAEGRLLFHVCAASNAAKLREYDVNFGILPLPKFDENQERYGSWVDPWHLALCVPSDCEDPERTSAILEVMAYHSYRLLYPAVVEQQLYGSGTRDLESLEMLQDYILPNVFFDFGSLYDSWGVGYSRMLKELIPIGSTDTASWIGQRRPKAEAHFDDLYDAALQNSYN